MLNVIPRRKWNMVCPNNSKERKNAAQAPTATGHERALSEPHAVFILLLTQGAQTPKLWPRFSKCGPGWIRGCRGWKPQKQGSTRTSGFAPRRTPDWGQESVPGVRPFGAEVYAGLGSGVCAWGKTFWRQVDMAQDRAGSCGARVSRPTFSVCTSLGPPSLTSTSRLARGGMCCQRYCT